MPKYVMLSIKKLRDVVMSLKNIKFPSKIFDFLIRVIIASFVYAICMNIFSILFQFLQFRSTSNDPLLNFVLSFLGGIFISLVLGFASTRFAVPFSARYVLIFLILFIIGYANNIIEYIFFSTTPIYMLYHEFAYILSTYMVTAAVIAFLFPPEKNDELIIDHLKRFFSGHSTYWWSFRIFAAGIAYVLIYFTFGLLVSPIVLPYYTDPTLGLELTVPSFGVLIPLEIGRGIIYVFMLVAPIAMTKLRSWRLVFFLTSILAGVGAIPGLLAAQAWPLELRIAHGLEIIADSFFYSLVIAKIFKKFSIGQNSQILADNSISTFYFFGTVFNIENCFMLDFHEIL